MGRSTKQLTLVVAEQAYMTDMLDATFALQSGVVSAAELPNAAFGVLMQEHDQWHLTYWAPGVSHTGNTYGLRLALERAPDGCVLLVIPPAFAPQIVQAAMKLGIVVRERRYSGTLYSSRRPH